MGPEARKLFQAAEAGRAVIYVPVLAILEVAEAARKGTLKLGSGFTAWLEALLASGRFLAVDLTTEILLHAERLYSIPERADRLIAATAVHLDCPLITRDPEVRAAGVEVIW